jgi:hypothetical protein
MATTKSKPKTQTIAINGDVIDGIAKGMTQSQRMATMITRPSLAAFTVKTFAPIAHDTDEFDIIFELQKAGAEVVGGDMGRIEKMPTALPCLSAPP